MADWRKVNNIQCNNTIQLTLPLPLGGSAPQEEQGKSSTQEAVVVAAANKAEWLSESNQMDFNPINMENSTKNDTFKWHVINRLNSYGTQR